MKQWKSLCNLQLLVMGLFFEEIVCDKKAHQSNGNTDLGMGFFISACLLVCISVLWKPSNNICMYIASNRFYLLYYLPERSNRQIFIDSVTGSFLYALHYTIELIQNFISHNADSGANFIFLWLLRYTQSAHLETFSHNNILLYSGPSLYENNICVIKQLGQWVCELETILHGVFLWFVALCDTKPNKKIEIKKTPCRFMQTLSND